jgi:hypothetical protein
MGAEEPAEALNVWSVAKLLTLLPTWRNSRWLGEHGGDECEEGAIFFCSHLSPEIASPSGQSKYDLKSLTAHESRVLLDDPVRLLEHWCSVIADPPPIRGLLRQT